MLIHIELFKAGFVLAVNCYSPMRDEDETLLRVFGFKRHKTLFRFAKGR